MLRAISAIRGRIFLRRYHNHSLNRFGYRKTVTRSTSMDIFRQTLEIIEDSEPERQETWRRERDERMKLKSNDRPRIVEVIEISDSEPSFSGPIDPHLPPSGLLGKTVISITDDSEVQQIHQVSAQDIPSPDTSPSNASTSTSTDSSSLSFNVKGVVAGIAQKRGPHQAQDSGSESSSEDETSAAFRNGIGQFAFSSRPSGSQTNRLTRTIPSSVALPAAKGTRAKPSQTTFLEFREGQLAELRKCVSCETKWTTRKSVAQKIMHIRTCAKKALLTDDTLKLLIAQEIEIAQAQTSKPSKKPQPKGSELPKTFIEDVLLDGGIQKVKKNSKIASSLKSVAENRDTILEKATSILNPQSTRVPDMLPPTQPLAPSKVSSNSSLRPLGETEITSTQPFGQSTLGGRFGRPVITEASGSHSRNCLSSAHQLPETLEPPPTQNYASSRFGNVQRTHSLFNRDSSPNSVNENNPDLLMNVDTVPELPPFTPVNDDDAILIWDPDAYPPRTPSPAKHKDKPRKRTTTKSKALNLNTNGDEIIGQIIEDDAELARRLKGMVVADEVLYLRILRYEPIHFDTFMDMAKKNGINAVALRTKMRTFLDRQAISHYGNEPGGSRSRH